MNISLGFSPCPNDCFIFDAIVNKRIDTQGIDFDLVMEDVETLNKKAFHSEIDITKLSFHAFAHCTENYFLLNSGSALGINCGPLLISKRKISKEEIAEGNLCIAIPGKFTTANLLFGLAFPNAKLKTEMIFSEIENALLNEKADAGLIIHENRFTYEEKGLKKIIDLGEYWEEKTRSTSSGQAGHPIPLGGIVMKRKFSNEIQHRVDALIRASVEYAFVHPDACMPFVRAHAQEMSEEVMMKHIELYVNEFSVDLGKEGRSAVEELFSTAKKSEIISAIGKNIFLD
ncbi:MAG: 1,4-dihydroxy-6-naphthoate synthase [Bacteroidetes bacterium]|nr:1,4-dihydroxy-6-naphthoate synthase [Bacteroidota bacterium]